MIFRFLSFFGIVFSLRLLALALLALAVMIARRNAGDISDHFVGSDDWGGGEEEEEEEEDSWARRCR
jgi:hypothetical protein